MTPLGENRNEVLMKIYDISQEVFSCEAFPGDPRPARHVVSAMADGALYNLSALSMCAHNGTHVDAPAHFIADGKTVDALSLEHFVGKATVITCEGELDAAAARALLTAAKDRDAEAARRLLIKGDTLITEAAARVFADARILTLGVESQTVGPQNAPMAAHLVLLGAEVVLLEGLRLSSVCDGVYLLSAAPLNLGGAEGAPCRAVLIE